MSKYVYLIWVEGGEAVNHNKYYEMIENPDGTFTARWGRVDVTASEKVYPMSKWYSTYASKVKKGYKDVTEMRAVPVVETKSKCDLFQGISEEVIKNVLQFLMDEANNAIKENYTISSQKVTRKMIDEAQSILNQIAEIQKKQSVDASDIRFANELLVKLFGVLPRRMTRVNDFLATKKTLASRLSDEQSLLDTMEGQVGIVQETEDNNQPCSSENILQQMGIEMSLVTSKSEKDFVYGLFENNSGNKRKVKNIYKVINKKTEKAFAEAQAADSELKKTMFLFHGSRNQNWFNILRSGLMIRPSGAVYTGSMFGDSIYFANKSQKSLGYSSLSGSYWAKGNSHKGFLAIYEVATGKQKHIYKHDSSCYSLNYDRIKREGFDSVYAHGGIDLKNDEFMVYRANQCTVRYLLEMEN